eukprot:Nitzschia sp. Nitz4//scaffold301_size22573//9899//10555//NITZ4_008552-RA/size22573-processed-gene-0.19-mRNA-1//1//CDS//3329547010//9354//frame0
MNPATTTKGSPPPTLLYLRDTERNVLPRSAYGVSVLNTLYWLWYSLDFIPAVNASPFEAMHIDPRVGYGALALGVGINSVTAFYPKSLVSKMEYSVDAKQLLVYQHDFPLLGPSPTPTVYPLGAVRMDASSPDTRKILEKDQGDLGRYEGHVSLFANESKIPILLDIRSPSEVKHSELLLQALLYPQSLGSSVSQKKKSKGKTSRSMAKVSKKQRRVK